MLQGIWFVVQLLLEQVYYNKTSYIATELSCHCSIKIKLLPDMQAMPLSFTKVVGMNSNSLNAGEQLLGG